MSRRTIGTFSTVAVLVCAALLGASASASAAIVVNGDFETGNLEGWATTSLNHNEKWRTYSSSEAGGGGLPVPPSGRFAAETLVGEASAGTTFLYQDVALPATPRTSSRSTSTTARPNRSPSPLPDTLFVSEATEGTVPANQQVRVDVLKPNAPIESLSPNDILATPYASKNGDPQELAPTLLTADLSAFAGQTVRLRIAAAAQEGALAVGVDDVSIASDPIVPPPVVTPTPTPTLVAVERHRHGQADAEQAERERGAVGGRSGRGDPDRDRCAAEGRGRLAAPQREGAADPGQDGDRQQRGRGDGKGADPADRGGAEGPPPEGVAPGAADDDLCPDRGRRRVAALRDEAGATAQAGPGSEMTRRSAPS